MDSIDHSISMHEMAIAEVRRLKSELMDVSYKLIEVLESRKKLLLMGNGGSAADAQHFAAELVVRFKDDRKSYPAIALTTDSSILTAIGNDFSFNSLFSRQIESLADEEDMVVAFSTSGNSTNLIQGILEAKKRNCFSVGFLGKDGGRLKDLVDIALVINSPTTACIQEAHMLMYHIICELFEEHLRGK